MGADRRAPTAAAVALLLAGLGGCTAATPAPAPVPPPQVVRPTQAVPSPAPTPVGPVTRVWATERATLAWPAEMTTDPEGNVWVREMGAMTVSKFAPDGRKLLTTGGLGRSNGQFDFHGEVHMFEGGIAASLAGEVVVADGTSRIQRFDREGRFLGRWQPPRTQRKVAVTGLDFGPSGALYMVRGTRVEVYGQTGDLLRSWGGLQDPDAIAVDAGERVYVADERTGRITKFDKTGKVLTRWGRHGTGDGEFGGDGTFLDMAVDQHALYVVDKHHQRVQRFSPTGRFLGLWSSGGQDLGSFNPGGVAVDPEGAVYVTENDLGRLIKFRLT
ncbi:NHL repeat-containing protein [Microlunatus flavus]|uniref:NHL repeat-containing protein n=1 Tax=Microlunatus flavus TaxID=1036181 RepID=A0A1H9I1X6_9ACTN|nr:hypothetical protein [Microlunatus flavus]SEQ68574.1 hypothetical protein SAMN05421756_10544 [Microlunatus flavus]